MTLSRRSFLSGVLVLAAFSLAPKILRASKPRIVGDGLHDDTQGLNALFAGQPVDIENGLAILNNGPVLVEGGVFRLTQSLIIPKGARVHIHGSKIICRESPWGDPVILFAGGKGTVDSVHFDARDYQPLFSEPRPS